MAPEIIDAWMQHPSREFLNQPMFDSLRRWAHGTFAPGDLSLEWSKRWTRLGSGSECCARGGRPAARQSPLLPAVCRVTSDRGPARSRKTLDAFSRSRREEKCARER